MRFWLSRLQRAALPCRASLRLGGGDMGRAPCAAPHPHWRPLARFFSPTSTPQAVRRGGRRPPTWHPWAMRTPPACGETRERPPTVRVRFPPRQRPLRERTCRRLRVGCAGVPWPPTRARGRAPPTRFLRFFSPTSTPQATRRGGRRPPSWPPWAMCMPTACREPRERLLRHRLCAFPRQWPLRERTCRRLRVRCTDVPSPSTRARGSASLTRFVVRVVFGRCCPWSFMVDALPPRARCLFASSTRAAVVADMHRPRARCWHWLIFVRGGPAAALCPRWSLDRRCCQGTETLDRRELPVCSFINVRGIHFLQWCAHHRRDSG